MFIDAPDSAKGFNLNHSSIFSSGEGLAAGDKSTLQLAAWIPGIELAAERRRGYLGWFDKFAEESGVEVKPSSHGGGGNSGKPRQDPDTVEVSSLTHSAWSASHGRDCEMASKYFEPRCPWCKVTISTWPRA